MSTTTLPAPAAAPEPGEDLRADITTALDKLAALGTPDQIRDYFVEQGMTACRGDAQYCVIAKHLRAQVGPEIALSVFTNSPVYDEAGVQYGDGTYDAHTDTYTDGPVVLLPAVVGEFVRHFDAGDYDALVAADRLG